MKRRRRGWCAGRRSWRADQCSTWRAGAVDREAHVIPGVEFLRADLEDGSPWPFAGRRFGGIVVTNYLHRPLFSHLAAALDEGGVLVYETFMLGNERFGKPSNPAFLLHPGELLKAFAGLTVSNGMR